MLLSVNAFLVYSGKKKEERESEREKETVSCNYGKILREGRI